MTFNHVVYLWKGKISKESLQLIHSYHLPKPSNAQQFTLEDLEADLILTMSPSHKDLIKSQYGQYSNVYTINEYAGIEAYRRPIWMFF